MHRAFRGLAAASCFTIRSAVFGVSNLSKRAWGIFIVEAFAFRSVFAKARRMCVALIAPAHH